MNADSLVYMWSQEKCYHHDIDVHVVHIVIGLYLETK